VQAKVLQERAAHQSKCKIPQRVTLFANPPATAHKHAVPGGTGHMLQQLRRRPSTMVPGVQAATCISKLKVQGNLKLNTAQHKRNSVCLQARAWAKS